MFQDKKDHVMLVHLQFGHYLWQDCGIFFNELYFPSLLILRLYSALLKCFCMHELGMPLELTIM